MSTDPPAQRRTLRSLGLALAVAAVLVIAVGTVAKLGLRGLILHVVAAHAGRPIRVNGDFDVHWFSAHPSISARRVVIENPGWMPPGNTAEIGRVVLLMQWRFAVLPWRTRRVELDEAQLHLLRLRSGRANWTARAEGPGKGPPLIESLAMPDAAVELHDDRKHIRFQGTVSAGDAVAVNGQAPPLHVEAHGQLNGRTASVSLEAEPLAEARNDRPYHFQAIASSGTTHLSASGSLDHAFDFRELHESFEASGPDLKSLYFLIGLSLPTTGTFRLTGQLSRKNDRFEYTDMALTTGASDLHGRMTVSNAGEHPALEGALHSERLRLADFGARSAAPETTPEAPATLKLPDTPLPVAALQFAEWNVSIRIHNLQLGPESLQAVSGSLLVQHGVFEARAFNATLAGGKLAITARLDARPALPHGELTATIEELQLSELLRPAPPAVSAMDGAVSGRVHLSGDGRSAQELGRSAQGSLALVIPHGEVRAALVQSASLELSGLFGRLHNSTKETGIRCAVTRLDVQGGVGTVSTLVMDTDSTLLTGAGKVDFASDSLDLTLRGRPKKPELALHSAVLVKGSLAHPEIRLAGHDAAGQTAAAVALGVLLTPVASVLAFVNLGLAHDADCAALTAEVAPSARPAGVGGT